MNLRTAVYSAKAVLTHSRIAPGLLWLAGVLVAPNGLWAHQPPRVTPIHTERASIPRQDVQLPTEQKSLRVQNVRFEVAPAIETAPSANLKFDVINAGAANLTDIVVEVSILEMLHASKRDAQPTTLAGPFKIQGRVVLEAGSTINYEMRCETSRPSAPATRK